MTVLGRITDEFRDAKIEGSGFLIGQMSGVTQPVRSCLRLPYPYPLSCIDKNKPVRID